MFGSRVYCLQKSLVNSRNPVWLRVDSFLSAVGPDEPYAILESPGAPPDRQCNEREAVAPGT